ncbi:FAD dependent oxidoreductase-domain-containing protein [Mycena latifolia]|nr:FAD dependent oxidoreductase-domain-containing protein [Mycena latifolia]
MSTRNSVLLNEGSTNELPPTADAVVIGSGMSGALTAFELLSSPNGPKKLIMLEAREACSGATGRNAGHCRPDAFRGFTAFSKRINPDQAMKIIAHEKLVLQLVKAFIDKHNIDCDFDDCRTFDVVMGEDFLQYVTGSFEAYREAGGDMSDIATRVPSALGAYEWSAASLHPAKLCQAILELNKSLGMALFTHTPAVTITASGNANHEWVVNTPRGSVTTPIVLTAVGVECIRRDPPAVFTVPCPARASPSAQINPYARLFGPQYAHAHIASLISTTPWNKPRHPRHRPGDFETKDDSVHDKTIEADCLANFKQVFSDWAEEVQGEGHEFGWTGILGLASSTFIFETKDAVPFIGPVPSLPGQFVIAGFNGHGMARTFGSAPGLAKIILGGSCVFNLPNVIGIKSFWDEFNGDQLAFILPVKTCRLLTVPFKIASDSSVFTWLIQLRQLPCQVETNLATGAAVQW